MNLTIIANKIWAWFWADPYAALSQVLTALAILREVLRRIEPYLLATIPQAAHSRFWAIWAQAMHDLEGISLSAPRNADAIRLLYEWQQRRRQYQNAAKQPQTAIVPIKRGNDETEGN